MATERAPRRARKGKATMAKQMTMAGSLTIKWSPATPDDNVTRGRWDAAVCATKLHTNGEHVFWHERDHAVTELKCEFLYGPVLATDMEHLCRQLNRQLRDLCAWMCGTSFKADCDSCKIEGEWCPY